MKVLLASHYYNEELLIDVEHCFILICVKSRRETMSSDEGELHESMGGEEVP